MIRRVTLSTWNRNCQTVARGRIASDVVTGVGVSQNARGRIVRQHALDTLAHLGRSVRYDHLARVQRIANPDAAAVMERHPARTARGVHQGIQYRPVCDRVASVQHGFCFTERRRDTTGVEVIAPYRDRCADLARRDQIIQCDTKARAISLAKPADPRGQSLEVNPLACELDPASEVLIVRKQIEHQTIRSRYVRRIARQRGPAKGSLPLAEQWPNVCRHETGEIERSFEAGVEGYGADVVSVVERHRAHLLQ